MAHGLAQSLLAIHVGRGVIGVGELVVGDVTVQDEFDALRLLRVNAASGKLYVVRGLHVARMPYAHPCMRG